MILCPAEGNIVARIRMGKTTAGIVVAPVSVRVSNGKTVETFVALRHSTGSGWRKSLLRVFPTFASDQPAPRPDSPEQQQQRGEKRLFSSVCVCVCVRTTSEILIDFQTALRPLAFINYIRCDLLLHSRVSVTRMSRGNFKSPTGFSICSRCLRYRDYIRELELMWSSTMNINRGV